MFSKHLILLQAISLILYMFFSEGHGKRPNYQGCIHHLLSFYDCFIGACCFDLNLTINLSGREGLAYNMFSGEYHVTNKYTDNGEEFCHFVCLDILCLGKRLFFFNLRYISSVPEQVQAPSVTRTCSWSNQVNSSVLQQPSKKNIVYTR